MAVLRERNEGRWPRSRSRRAEATDRELKERFEDGKEGGRKETTWAKEETERDKEGTADRGGEGDWRRDLGLCVWTQSIPPVSEI